MEPALLLHAADDAAGGLRHGDYVDTDDEGNEVMDFGLGAINFARMQPAGVLDVGPLAFGHRERGEGGEIGFVQLRRI